TCALPIWLSPATQTALVGHPAGTPLNPALLGGLVDDLNAVLSGPLLWDPARFAGHRVRPSTLARVGAPLDSQQLLMLNREVLSEAFPVDLSDLALAFEQGLVALSRCGVLGAAHVHRLECSESILDDLVDVEDAQDGCVRFSAWST